MSVKKIPLAVLIATFVFVYGSQPTLAETPSSPGAAAYAIHEDLLKCYQYLGKGPEIDGEFRWILLQRPGNATLHFNYGVFLQRAGKTVLASAQYKLAATQDPSNVDYVGTYGQMLLYQKQYKEAYQYLGRAIQMAGGEKYKASFEAARQYMQLEADKIARDHVIRPGAPPGGGPSKGKPKDDDD